MNSKHYTFNAFIVSCDSPRLLYTTKNTISPKKPPSVAAIRAPVITSYVAKNSTRTRSRSAATRSAIRDPLNAGSVGAGLDAGSWSLAKLLVLNINIIPMKFKGKQMHQLTYCERPDVGGLRLHLHCGCYCLDYYYC